MNTKVGGDKKKMNRKKNRGIVFCRLGSAFNDGCICNAGSSRRGN